MKSRAEELKEMNSWVMEIICDMNINNISVEEGKKRIVNAINEGADINRIDVFDNDGMPRSPFINANEHRNYEIIEFLLSKGLNKIVDENFYNYIISGHYLDNLQNNQVIKANNPLNNLLAEEIFPLFLQILEIVKKDVAELDSDIQPIISNALIQNGHNASIETLEFLSIEGYQIPDEVLLNAVKAKNTELSEYLVNKDLSVKLNIDDFNWLFEKLKYNNKLDPIKIIEHYKKMNPDFISEFKVEDLINNASGKHLAWIILRGEQNVGGLNVPLLTTDNESLKKLIIKKMCKDPVTPNDMSYHQALTKIFDCKNPANEDIRDAIIECLLTGTLSSNNSEEGIW